MSDLCSSDAKISSIIIVLCVKFVSFIEKVTIRYIRKMLGSAAVRRGHGTRRDDLNFTGA